MCGIAGAVGVLSDRISKVRLLAQSLLHRGPDDYGEYDDDLCTLAMRRLSIIDVAGGHQPISNETGDVVSVCNGEIYNFKGLRKSLETSGHKFTTHSDVEVAVHGYEAWGEDVLAKLNGMFALAIWDRRVGRLLLARDRLGKKPLYYSARTDSLLFASELRSLLAVPDSRWTVDREACQDFCLRGYFPDDRTPITEIRRLRPGHVGVWSPREFSQRRYWKPSPAAVPGDRAEARETLFELLKDAVGLRLISDVPVGAFLSGGLDSSTVIAIAAGVLNARIPTFSVTFPNSPGYDEGGHARAVAQYFRCDHHEIPMSAAEFERIEDVIWSLDEPLADPAALPTLALSRAARKQVTVALTGEGADEVFGGYERYALSMRGSQLSKWIPGAGAAARAGLALRRKKSADDSTVSRTLRAMRDGGRNALHWSRSLAVAPAVFPERIRLLNEQWRAGERGNANGASRLSLVQLDDLENLLANSLLNKVDRMTMAASLEARCPYLDYRVVEFGLGLPDPWKMRGLTSKVLLREVARDLLPPTIFNRRKHTFRVPLASWLRGPLQPLLDAVCQSPVLAAFGIIDLVTVRQLANAHMDGHANYSRSLWALITLNVWLQEAGRRTRLDPSA